MIAEVHHFAAIAGTVTNEADGKPVRGAIVEIVSAPEPFRLVQALREQQFGRKWRWMQQRVDRTVTGEDGHFHFLDLPNGDYIIAVRAAGALEAAKVEAGVARKPNTVEKPVKADAALKFPAVAPPKPPGKPAPRGSPKRT
jgi:hypothetical protein